VNYSGKFDATLPAGLFETKIGRFGAHCRSAVGLAELPFNIPVEIEGEVELYQ